MFEKYVFAGYLIYRNIKKRPTTTVHCKKFLLHAFGVNPASNSWFSHFCYDQHFSYHDTAIANWSEFSLKKRKDVIDYINRIRMKQIPHNKIATVDKTRVYLDSHRVRHISIKGGYYIISFYLRLTTLRGQPRRYRSNRGRSVVIYSMLVADGTLGPLYVETNFNFGSIDDKDLPKETYLHYLPKNTKRRGESGFLHYLKHCVRTKSLVKQDLLITDNERSFKTLKVKSYEEKQGLSQYFLLMLIF